MISTTGATGHSLAEVTAIVRELKPQFKPGAHDGRKASSSDTNYRLLGAIIESVTGKPFAQAVAEEIFAVLQLSNTYVYGASELSPDWEPAAIFVKDRLWQHPGFFSTNQPEGGIVSTLADSLAFLQGFFGGKLFDRALLDRMIARWNRIFFPMQYGYGIMRINLPRAFSPLRGFPEYIGRSGTTGSFAYYSPDKQLYLTGTVNQLSDPSRPIRLMMKIANKAA
jgi:CubicO group peptidase (beta-lactamase class C family)